MDMNQTSTLTCNSGEISMFKDLYWLPQNHESIMHDSCEIEQYISSNAILNYTGQSTGSTVPLETKKWKHCNMDPLGCYLEKWIRSLWDPVVTVDLTWQVKYLTCALHVATWHGMVVPDISHYPKSQNVLNSQSSKFILAKGSYRFSIICLEKMWKKMDALSLRWFQSPAAAWCLYWH